ncbi:TetR/AcrR family transcriptional regulator [Rhodococcus aetherivorans]|uniref:TetR/AcrR family transcriptional regulator n=1 Tax=Rhodococcus aetherivorans TaxID=191292 RepID=UPI00365B856B
MNDDVAHAEENWMPTRTHRPLVAPSAKPASKRQPPIGQGKRRNRDSEVMAAAIRLIYEKGYDGASLQDVANEVGVLKGSLYYYFASKEDLLVRIMKESHAQVEDIYRGIEAQDLSPLDKLLSLLGALMTWYLDHTPRVAIYFNERHRLSGERLQEVDAEGRRFEQMIQSYLLEAQRAGEINDQIDTKLAVRFIIGALNSVPMWYRPGHGLSKKKIIDQFVRMNLKSLTP